MSFAFKKVGLIGTHRNPLVAETVQHVHDLLVDWGLAVVLEQETADALEHIDEKGARLKSLGERIDVAITVGGDGNLLQAARVLSIADVPVIGINRGQLGFLTDIRPDELAEHLKPMLCGDYAEEKRSLLEGLVQENGKTRHQGNALNDIVLFPGDIAQLIEFEIEINGQFVYSQRSDGLIISTPTGSTAYALSAGGPIVEPHLNVTVLVPKFPHTLTSRPIVIDADSKITIHLAEYNKIQPRLSFDGQSHTNLEMHHHIIIQKQTQPLRLLHPKGHDYFNVLREKLHWGRQLIPMGK